jgi:hypothetical protein
VEPEEAAFARQLLGKYVLAATNILCITGNVDDCGAMLDAGRPLVRVPMTSLHFIDFPNSFNRTMALCLTQLLTEMSTRDLSGSKARPTRKADVITAICVPTV